MKFFVTFALVLVFVAVCHANGGWYDLLTPEEQQQVTRDQVEQGIRTRGLSRLFHKKKAAVPEPEQSGPTYLDYEEPDCFLDEKEYEEFWMCSSPRDNEPVKCRFGHKKPKICPPQTRGWGQDIGSWVGGAAGKWAGSEFGGWVGNQIG